MLPGSGKCSREAQIKRESRSTSLVHNSGRFSAPRRMITGRKQRNEWKMADFLVHNNGRFTFVGQVMKVLYGAFGNKETHICCLIMGGLYM